MKTQLLVSPNFYASIALLFMIFAVSGADAWAYIGPGAGLSMLGSFFALLAGIGIALAVIIFWPIRQMLRRRKQQTEDEKIKNQEASSPPPVNGS